MEHYGGTRPNTSDTAKDDEGILERVPTMTTTRALTEGVKLTMGDQVIVIRLNSVNQENGTASFSIMAPRQVDIDTLKEITAADVARMRNRNHEPERGNRW